MQLYYIIFSCFNNITFLWCIKPVKNLIEYKFLGKLSLSCMHCCVIKEYKISASQLINAIRKYMVCLCASPYECVFSVYLWLIHPSPLKWNSSRSAQINKKAATSTLSMIAVENDKIAPAEEEPHPGLIEQMKVERDRSTRWCRPNPDSPLICHDKSSAAANRQCSPLH